MKRKLLSLLLAVCMLVSVVPMMATTVSAVMGCTVSAEVESEYEGEITFEDGYYNYSASDTNERTFTIKNASTDPHLVVYYGEDKVIDCTAKAFSGYCFKEWQLYGVDCDWSDTVATSTGFAFTAVFDEIPQEMDSAEYYASLSLEADLALYLTIKKFGTDFKPELLKVNGDKVIVDKTGVVKTRIGARSPSDIDTEFDIKVEYDGKVVKSFTYSITEYCEAVIEASGLGDTSLKDLATLCETVLKYRDCAQKYSGTDEEDKNYKEETVDVGNYGLAKATSFINKSSSRVLSATAKLTISNVDGTISLTYNVYTIEDDLKDKFYVLNDDATPAKLKDLVSVERHEEGELYRYEITVGALPMYRLSHSFTLRIKGIDESVFRVTYGVFNYCKYVNEQQTSETYTETLKSLCRVIYAYGACSGKIYENQR